MISLIILAKGNEKGLDKCVDSILQQSYKEYELILMTEQQDNELERKIQNNTQVKLYTSENEDMGVLCKKAIQKATGEYIMFVDPQDFLIDDKGLTKLNDLIVKEEADLIVNSYMTLKQGRFLYKTEKNEILSYDRFQVLQLKEIEFRNLSGALIKKELFNKINNYDLPAQLLLKRLAKEAEKILYTSLNFYTYVVEESRNSDLIWGKGSEFHFSNTYNFVENNKIRQYKQKIPETIEVALCVDNNVIDYVGSLVYSIYKHTSSYVNIYVIYKELSAESLNKLNWINEKMLTVNLQTVKVSEKLHERLDKITLGKDKYKLPISSYYRIFLADILPDVDRIIYLDVDVLAIGDLTELWHTDLEGNFLAACLDEQAFTKSGTNVLQPRRREYFNSGVLVLDLFLFRKYNIISEFFDYLIDTTDLYNLGDQDALNLYFLDAVKLLDSSWNYGVYSHKKYSGVNDIKILHYFGFSKPLRSLYSYVADDKIKYFVQLYRKYYYELAQFIDYKGCENKVSIIITARPDDDFFRSLESVVYQSYPNKEIIILDTTVGDELKNKVETLMEILPYIVYIKCDNRNIGKMREFAINRSKGDYLYFLDSSDYINENDVLDKLVSIMVKDAASMVTSVMMIYYPTEDRLTGYGANNEKIDLSAESVESLQTNYPGNDYNMLAGHVFDKKLFDNLEALNFEDEKKLMSELLSRAKKRIRKNSYDWVKVMS
ncbi:glycosyltransferase [Ligilactobacillus salivarius]|uniref:Glycosyltransferase n=1 Tax=Ligilactobacillus salivarius TaxID=1624 RepID=A0ABD7YVX0_9LACO|nr:glycosyltransferase [Ligilactobacillus salivarius]WHS05945.1 glycosyltransferase [Ligilactobacillus salivarius]WHS07974.1 glycosyltransferase [Ligilactobacillus salivarius]WHS09859.1 glycosyltransferase [Ligilactobacillus salivarius]WHS13799.1 glycosyltransferase [Ligilactobacillus salivarius]WHS17587.1 glycosyltransferase [Ligilactobacillus salivarius]